MIAKIRQDRKNYEVKKSVIPYLGKTTNYNKNSIRNNRVFPNTRRGGGGESKTGVKEHLPWYRKNYFNWPSNVVSSKELRKSCDSLGMP